MKFVCENPDCEKFGVVDEEFNNTYKMVDGHLLSDKAPCPVCGKIRKELANNVPLSEKNIYIGSYTMASPEQRREILKKRSHEHYEKEIKPFKENQLHEAVSQFKSIK